MFNHFSYLELEYAGDSTLLEYKFLALYRVRISTKYIQQIFQVQYLQ